jgi:hypothetical protein
MICRIVHLRPSAVLFERSHPRSSRESQRFPAEGVVILTIPDLEQGYTLAPLESTAKTRPGPAA